MVSGAFGSGTFGSGTFGDPGSGSQSGQGLSPTSLYPTFPAPSLFDQVQRDTALPKYDKSWRFDFDSGDFVLEGDGKVAITDRWEAWKQWCFKAVLTPRYVYPIYSSDYGSELDPLIGSGYTRQTVELEITRMITEALKVNPRTRAVTNFSFSWNGSSATINCQVWPTVGDPTTLEVSLNG